MKTKIESKALPDGGFGVFVAGQLIQRFENETESDAHGIMMGRLLIVAGIAKQDGTCLRDGKPYDLFAEFGA